MITTIVKSSNRLADNIKKLREDSDGSVQALLSTYAAMATAEHSMASANISVTPTLFFHGDGAAAAELYVRQYTPTLSPE
jgi:hypothetical protein